MALLRAVGDILLIAICGLLLLAVDDASDRRTSSNNDRRERDINL